MFDQCPDEIYSISSIRWRAAFSMMIEKPKFPLDNLPEELIIKIASYLGEKDLFTLSHLNRKAFRVLALKLKPSGNPCLGSLSSTGKLLSYFNRGSITVRVTSSLTDLDSTKTGNSLVQ